MPPGAASRPGRAARSPRAVGRRVAFVVYYGLLAAICIAATTQITRQIFGAHDAPAPYASCRDGLRALALAVDRARRAAPGIDGEDPALDRFRAALEPDWSYRDTVARSCAGSEKDEAALDAIERLRYAEEHAVRREAGDLAPLRRRVQSILESDLGLHGAGASATGPNHEPLPPASPPRPSARDSRDSR